MIGALSAAGAHADLQGFKAEADFSVFDLFNDPEAVNTQIALNIAIATVPLFGVIVGAAFKIPLVSKFIGKIGGILAETGGSALKRILPKFGDEFLYPGLALIKESHLKAAFSKSLAGEFNVGSASILRKAYADLIGTTANKLKNISFEAHHVIPASLKNHKFLRDVSFNIDSAINAIPLKRPFHSFHNNYNDAMELALDEISRKSRHLPLEKQREQVVKLISNANEAILSGKAPHQGAGISIDEWYRLIKVS